MEEQAYHELAAFEQTHWWHCGRRAILRTVLGQYVARRPARIAEIGCGTGGNLALLQEFGETVGVEASATALAYSRSRSTASVIEGSLPDRVPLAAASCDAVCLLDVLEHVEDDVAALRACRRLLAPAGRLFVTVPAYPWLWSAHDVEQHHRRRYTRQSLLRVAAAAGVTPLFVSHFNAWLLLPAIAARLWDRLWPGRGTTGLHLPPPRVNTLLYRIFSSERLHLHRHALPFGLSICAVFAAAGDG